MKLIKKCIICDEPAAYCIKGTSDFYCCECAHDSFADISYLQKIEEEAQKLKRIVEEKIKKMKKMNEDEDDYEDTGEEEKDYSDVDVAFKIDGKER